MESIQPLPKNFSRAFEMTRIALIAGTYQPHHCGVAHYTSHLRQELSQRGIDSTVLTTAQAAQHSQEKNIIGAVRSWRIQDLASLVRSLHQTSVDLLHIQHAAGTYGFDRAIFLLPALLKVTGWQQPIVTTIHEYGWWEWQPQWLPASLLEQIKTWGQSHTWWDREDGFLLTGSDAIITTNYSATQVIHARLPNLAARIHEVPISANIDIAMQDQTQARSTLRQHCGWPADSVVIVFFGFLHPVKGLETLLPAFKQVSVMQPQARLLLLGGVESLALPAAQATEYWQRLQDTIATLNLHTVVHLTGYVDDATASQYLLGADVGVLPFNHGVTLKSGSLLALMAHALPVVATRSTPPDPALTHAPVRFVTPRNEDELALSLSDLLKDNTRRKQLSVAGQAYSQSFSWEAIAEKHVEIYQHVLRREKDRLIS